MYLLVTDFQLRLNCGQHATDERRESGLLDIYSFGSGDIVTLIIDPDLRTLSISINGGSSITGL